VNLTRELAAQWAGRVRVNALAPGWFESEATEELLQATPARQWLRRRTPLGRGAPRMSSDGALLFLASSAKFVHDWTGSGGRRRLDGRLTARRD